jgi:hypothetical protein
MMGKPLTYREMLAEMYGSKASKIKVDGYLFIVDPKNTGDIWDRVEIRKAWQVWTKAAIATSDDKNVDAINAQLQEIAAEEQMDGGSP